MTLLPTHIATVTQQVTLRFQHSWSIRCRESLRQISGVSGSLKAIRMLYLSEQRETLPQRFSQKPSPSSDTLSEPSWQNRGAVLEDFLQAVEVGRLCIKRRAHVRAHTSCEHQCNPAVPISRTATSAAHTSCRRARCAPIAQTHNTFRKACTWSNAENHFKTRFQLVGNIIKYQRHTPAPLFPSAMGSQICHRSSLATKKKPQNGQVNGAPVLTQ